MVETDTAGTIDGESEPFNIEYRIQTKNGDWVWLRDRLIERTDKDGEVTIQGHAEDITEEERWKDELTNERHRLSATIEGTDVGTWNGMFRPAKPGSMRSELQLSVTPLIRSHRCPLKRGSDSLTRKTCNARSSC